MKQVTHENDMQPVEWYCPHCGMGYILTELIHFDEMNECCQYYFGKESFLIYRRKHTNRA